MEERQRARWQNIFVSLTDWRHQVWHTGLGSQRQQDLIRSQSLVVSHWQPKLATCKRVLKDTLRGTSCVKTSCDTLSCTPTTLYESESENEHGKSDFGEKTSWLWVSPHLIQSDIFNKTLQLTIIKSNYHSLKIACTTSMDHRFPCLKSRTHRL